MPVHTPAALITMSYLLVQFFPNGAAVPVGATLHAQGNGYTFYPLPNSGPVWTLDDQLWRAAADRSSNSTAAFSLEMQEAIAASAALPSDQRWLAGVIEAAHFWPVGSQGELALPEFSEWQVHTGVKSATSLGFDVLDPMGLSALTNVGFTSDEAKSVAGLGFVGNENGLLIDAKSAERFARFASNSAPEHAPFVGVEVFLLSRESSGV